MAGLFMAAKEAGLVSKGGGHAMAAGFTVEPEKIPELHQFFREEAARILSGAEIFEVEEVADGIATIRGMRPDFVRMLEMNAGPFGQENPEPRFVLSSVKIISADIVGTDHVRLQLSDIEGGTRMKAVAFKSADTALGEALLNGRGKGFHLMGQFKVNEWNGSESVEFHVSDAAYLAEAAE
jgi:single-stranded-DNA-specific exonuclease